MGIISLIRLLFLSPVFASGLTAAPAKFDLHLEKQEQYHNHITVTNTGKDTLKIDLKAAKEQINGLSEIYR